MICVSLLAGTSIYRESSVSFIANSSSSFLRTPPGWTAWRNMVTSFHSVIVGYLDIYGTAIPYSPLKENSPLAIDTHTELAASITGQGFKTVASQSA